MQDYKAFVAVLLVVLSVATAVSEVEHVQLQAKLKSLEAQLQETGVGSTYIRWGRTTCPANNELVYKGYSAGSHFTHSGGAANWLCLSDQPQWDYYETGASSRGKVYGAEYEFGDYHSDGGKNYFNQNLNDHDAPCSLCRTPRSSAIMIPGRRTCFPGWTKEYSGYLVSGAYHHISATEYICLDSRAEMMVGGAPNTNGRVMYLTEAKCGTLKCPPYHEGRELTCVVCSK